MYTPSPSSTSCNFTGRMPHAKPRSTSLYTRSSGSLWSLVEECAAGATGTGRAVGVALPCSVSDTLCGAARVWNRMLEGWGCEGTNDSNRQQDGFEFNGREKQIRYPNACQHNLPPPPRITYHMIYVTWVCGTRCVRVCAYLDVHVGKTNGVQSRQPSQAMPQQRQHLAPSQRRLATDHALHPLQTHVQHLTTIPALVFRPPLLQLDDMGAATGGFERRQLTAAFKRHGRARSEWDTLQRTHRRVRAAGNCLLGLHATFQNGAVAGWGGGRGVRRTASTR
jgi:hypothetical protein